MTLNQLSQERLMKFTCGSLFHFASQAKCELSCLRSLPHSELRNGKKSVLTASRGAAPLPAKNWLQQGVLGTLGFYIGAETKSEDAMLELQKELPWILVPP